MRVYFTAILCVLLSADFCAAVVPERITVAFRYDDPSAKTNTDIEDQVIAAFRQYNMCCTFAVIPFVCAGDCHDPGPQEYLPLPVEKAEMFVAAVREGVLEIAQHGYQAEDYSEFAGLNYEEQVQKIKKGKEFLEQKLGMPVLTFVPPWNTYDENTLIALEKAGFTHLSASARGVASSATRLQFLPATVGITQLKHAVVMARQTLDRSPVIVALFHPYNFTEVDPLRGLITFDEFTQTLEWISQQEDVRVEPIRHIQSLRRERYVANKWLRLPLPTALQVYPHVYLSSSGVQATRLKWAIRVGSLYGGILLTTSVLCFIIAGLVLPRMAAIASRLTLLLGPVLLVAGLVWTFHDAEFGVKGLIAVVCVLGACIGVWAATLSRHRWAQVWKCPLRPET